MNPAVAIRSPIEFDEEINPTFRTLILYENFERGQYASSLCERLGRQLGPDWQLRLTAWKLDLLRHPELLAAAVREAHEAHMIVVSAGADWQLPPEIANWIELALGNEKRPRAVVALLDCANNRCLGETSAHRFLKQAAQRANMDFFANLSNCPQEDSQSSASTIVEQAGRRSGGWAETPPNLPRPDPWGINE
jgi:hypothetical protein